MTPRAPMLRALVGKELRQVRRGKGAIASATLLPLLLLVVVPLSQLFTLSLVRGAPSGLESVPPGLADLAEPRDLFLRLLFPLFVTLGGLVVPSVAATYTVIAERERRTLELLMALPVRVTDILAAKVVATLALAAGVVLPLFLVDALVLLALGVAGPGYLTIMLALLLAALACAVGFALLLALLARDFRTANNLNGALVGPLSLLTIGILLAVPGDPRFAALIGALLLVATLALVIARRWLTFERYLA